jgi:hypothetical protein
MKTGLKGALLIAVLLAPLLARAAIEAGTLANELETFFGIFLLQKDRRSAQDRVLVNGSGEKGFTAEISYWRSLQSRDSTEEVCNAYKWLLFGRGSYGKGASEAFAQYPALTQVELRFFDVESGTKLGKKKGEILPTSRVIPYLKIGVERKSLLAKKADWKQVKEKTTKGNCADLGTRYLDSRWFDEAYLKQARKGG